MFKSKAKSTTGNSWSKQESKKNVSVKVSRDWSRLRLVGVGLIFVIFWVLLWYRAWQVQVVMGPELYAMAQKQHHGVELRTGRRGSILDRTGQPLARSVEMRSVFVRPLEVEDPNKVIDFLSKELALPKDKVKKVFESKQRFVWVARMVNDQVAEAILKAELPGVYLTTEYKRVYPFKQLAGQLLGFVGLDDNGLEGIEKAFDAKMIGHTTRQVVQRDAVGRKLYLNGTEKFIDLMGEDIQLTIDAQIQFFAEEALAKAVELYQGKWGGCMVVHVPSGEILAWAEYPFFNPNNHSAYKPGMWRNRLITDAMEHGSTMKPFLVAAALAEKRVKPETSFFCEKGLWKYKSITIRDTRSYANLNVSEILTYSSNIGVAKIGMSLGSTRYHSYLTKLGFGGKTGLPLPGESKGILRSPKQWAEVDLLNISFGQGFSATGAQLAQAYLALLSGGVEKHLKIILNDATVEFEREINKTKKSGQKEVQAEDSTQKDSTYINEVAQADQKLQNNVPERIFDEEVTKTVIAMLRNVVEEDGTGQRARISGVMVGGKTGTAQKAQKGGYGSARMASFVGVLPIENPQYLILTFVDEPAKSQYGGVVAAPVFRQVATKILAYKGELPEEATILAVNDQIGFDYDEEEIPILTAKNNKIDKKKIENTKNNKKVNKESSSQNQEALNLKDYNIKGAVDTQIVVGLESKENVVPNVTGQSLRSALEIFAKLGIVPAIKGYGQTVLRQEPSPGTSFNVAEAVVSSEKKQEEYVIWLSE